MIVFQLTEALVYLSIVGFLRLSCIALLGVWSTLAETTLTLFAELPGRFTCPQRLTRMKGRRTPSLSSHGDMDCCICLYPLLAGDDLVITPCSHIFHYSCAHSSCHSWYNKRRSITCPFCRAELTCSLFHENGTALRYFLENYFKYCAELHKLKYW